MGEEGSKGSESMFPCGNGTQPRFGSMYVQLTPPTTPPAPPRAELAELAAAAVLAATPDEAPERDCEAALAAEEVAEAMLEAEDPEAEDEGTPPAGTTATGREIVDHCWPGCCPSQPRVRTVVVEAAHWLPPVTAMCWRDEERRRFRKGFEKERGRRERGKRDESEKKSYVVTGKVPGLNLLPRSALSETICVGGRIVEKSAKKLPGQRKDER
jgi:hypothetical protein